MTLKFLILFLICLKGLYFREQFLVLLNRVGQVTRTSEIFYSPIGSSWEGHALLILEGYGFMDIYNYSINCVFKSLTTSKTYYSKIYKEQALCVENDYECLYWQTSYDISDDTMACYTPRIPDEDRPDIRATSTNQVFQVSLEIINEENNTRSSLNCANPNACRVTYHNNFTPQMVAFNPTHFYPGSSLSFWVKPRTNGSINLKSIKIGPFVCATDFPDDYYYNWDYMYLKCNTGTEMSSGTVGGFLVDYSFGQPAVNSLFQKFQIDPANLPNLYYFKIFPYIESLSVNSGTSKGGQLITLKGRGFSLDNTKVYFNTIECIDGLSVSTNEISFILPEAKFTFNSLDKNIFFLGSQGLRRRIYNLPDGNLSSLKGLSGFPDNTDKLYLDDVYLETQTLPLNLSNYGQYFNGYFKALYTGKYRFWSTSDDASQVFLSTDQSTFTIIDLTYWAPYFDYVSQNDRTGSKWIDLEKDKYYYFEIYHAQGGGEEHYQLGVEIKSDDAPVDSPNKISKFESFYITPKISRDLFKIVINTLNKNEYKMTCKLKDGTYKSIDIDPNSSARTLRINLNSLLDDYKLIVRKVGYNDSNQYYLGANENFDDSSYSQTKTFSNMYLNLSGSQSVNSIPLETVSTGSKTGVVFLVFIDRRASERTYIVENNCYLSSPKQQFIDIQKVQSVSPDLTGTFSLKVKNNIDTSESYDTTFIDVTTFSTYTMFNALNDIPLLTDEINLWYTRSEIEDIRFYVRYSKYANVNVSVNMNKLAGGIDDSPTIEIKSMEEDVGNLFFMPIPPDFLYVKNTLPQIRVVSNGLEAVCLPGICSYTILDAINYPTIVSFNLDSSDFSVTVKLDSLFSDSKIVPSIGFGPNVCGSPANLDQLTFTYSCTLVQPIIGGKYPVYVKITLGNLSSSVIEKGEIPIKITNVTPKEVFSTGGSLITITGTGYPEKDSTGLEVSAGGAKCILQSFSNTEITCIVGKKENSDPLTITYNGVSASSDISIFKYIDPSDNIPSVLSITPDSVSPGEKQTLNILFNKDISNFSSGLDNIVVKIVHKTKTNYEIRMNPLSISTNTLTVKYGGAQMGEYLLYVKLDDSTPADYNLIFIVTIELTHISTKIGSTMGGTILTLTGVNFLSTQINQVVYIGKTPCKYISNSKTSIECITQPPNASTLYDSDESVVIEQMIQHDSLCKIDNGNGCVFKYSTYKTATINSIVSANSDFIFELNSEFTINGYNLILGDDITELKYDWGKITIKEKYETQITGKISEITKYGLFKFDFKNDFGYAIHDPQDSSYIDGESNVLILLKKPINISSVTSLSIGEQGAIFKLYSDATDFLSNIDSNGNILNKISICNGSCVILNKNILNDDQNNFQCMIDTPTIATSFTNCSIQLTYYNSVVTLSDPIKISADSNNNRVISTVTVDDINVTSYSFKINNPANFVLKITLASTDDKLTDLKLIVENKFVFGTSSVSTNSSGNAVYSFNLDKGLPAGLLSCAVHSDSLGFLQPPSSITIKNAANVNTAYFRLKVNAKLTAYESIRITNSSLFGGVSTEISGVNLNRIISNNDDEVIVKSPDSFQKVYVCDILAEIKEFSSKSISFKTPVLLKYDYFSSKKILTESEINITKDPAYSEVIQEIFDSGLQGSTNLMDNNPFTAVSTTKTSFLGIRVKSTVNPKFKIKLSKINVFIGKLAKPNDLSGAYVEGSNDGTTWTKIVDLSRNFLFQWSSIYLDKSENNAPYSYIRLVPNAATYIAEIRYFGNVVFQSAEETVSCSVRIKDNFNDLTIENFSIIYDVKKTYVISSIEPEYGPSVGGSDVKFVLSSGNSLTGSETISIEVFSNPLLDIKINTSETLHYFTASMIAKDNDKYNQMKPLLINIETIGNVYSDIYYRYQDRWSNKDTWGGEFIPIDGETAFIKNTDVILDVPNINLNTLIIENGSVTVEDGRDYNLSANVILVRSGKFIVGSEDKPFKNKFTLTLKSQRTDPVIPIFGNKVLAVMEGQLEIHGKPKTPTFTYINKTFNKGDSVITIVGPVNWEVGDEIAIASSNSTPYEAELKTIVQILDANTEVVTITLNTSLQFTHYGKIETYGDNDVFDMRAEVAVLTRNVVIQGDESSINTQYGSHVMLTAMKMDMNTDSSMVTYGKISYVEVRRAGQAFQLGRYPIHFHMIGDVSGSYVKGCSIHHTFNRALTIHAVRNFLVESNVAFDVKGHTFFIEDGVETDNRIINNIGFLTRKSTSLLNADFHPATFWLTNPSNYVEGNHAAGSDFYGFWMDIPKTPTGLNRNVIECPRDLPLGSFKDNVSHSNGKYGVRVFPEFTPKSKTCLALDGNNVVTVKAVFSNLTIYANKEKGLVTETIGNVVFEKVRAADHSLSSMEVSDLAAFPEGMAGFSDSFIVGKSQNPAIVKNNFSTKGLITPRADRFIVDNIRFYSFEGLSLFASCSRCDLSSASTDSDARTIFFKNIKSDGTESKKVHWTSPRRAIFRDLDGTLTGSSGPAWATPYYIHNLAPQCKRDIPKWDDGLICDDTVQVRRVAFNENTPNIFTGQPMKIMRLIDKLDNIDQTALDSLSNFSSIGFKEFKDPNKGWAVGFVTGYNYLISFANVGLNFNSLALERSIMWESQDRPINLVFNYTYRRDEFTVTGTDNQSKSYSVTNTTDITLLNGDFMSSNNNVEYGKFFNNLIKKHLYLRVNAYNPNNYKNLKLKVTAIQCANNDCGVAPPSDVPKEDTIRKWSNPDSWPNNKVPVDGDEVVIKQEWTMMLDVSTAQVKMLTIYGTLYADVTQEKIELKADNILIYGGKLQIGSKDAPFTKSAKISLTSNKFSPNIALSNDIQFTNNAIVNIGEFEIYGVDRAPYVSRLKAKAAKGSDIIQVDKDLKWSKDDQIVLTSTTHDPSQIELLKIVYYDPSTGQLKFSPVLKYDHYGAEKGTEFPDNPLNPLLNLDERAEIYMITRNINIGGFYDYWACNIMTSKYQSKDFLYYGRTTINHAQITNCGQTDTDFGALQFVQHNTIRSVSSFDGVSLYNNPYVGIKVVNSNDITFKNMILYQQKQYGVYVVASERITMNKVSVVHLQKRLYPPQYNDNKIMDLNTCYYVCVEGGTCKDVQLIETTCAGSEFFGYVVECFECTLDLTNRSIYNYVYSAEYAYLVMNPNNYSCMKGGNVIAYNNKVGYASYAPALLSIHENILSSNNLFGVIVLNGATEVNTRKILRRSLIVGQNKENPNCFNFQKLCTESELCKQMGFVLSVTSINPGITIPIKKKNFPLFNPKNDATFGSFFDGYDISFVNFEDQCDYNSYVMNSNEFSSDMSSVHNFRGITLTRVLDENLVYFELPKKSWIGDPCGAWPCTGPNNILVRITSFKNSKETFDNSQITRNSKWSNPSTKKYIKVNTPTEPLQFFDGVELIPSNPFQNMGKCATMPTWQGLLCQPDRYLGLILFENLDAESETKNVTPIKITSFDETDPFTNAINTFQDHGCERGYPDFTRTARFPSIIQLDKKYNIEFTGTNPQKMRFELVDPDWDNNKYIFNSYQVDTSNQVKSGVVIKMQYQNPQSVLVYDLITGVEIRSKEYKEGEEFSQYTCGASKWTPVKNTLELYITNTPDCNLLLNTVNSIQLSLRLSLPVEEFYSKNGSNNLVYNIAAVLGIPTEQIRITGVRKGSTIIEMQILENIPSVSKADSGQVTVDPSTKLNLASAISTIAENIKTNKLSLPAPVLDFTAKIIAIVLDPTNPNSGINTGINTGDNEFTFNSQDYATIYETAKHPVDSERTIVENLDFIKYMLIIIIVGVCLIVIGFLAYYFISKKSKKNAGVLEVTQIGKEKPEDNNMIEIIPFERKSGNSTPLSMNNYINKKD